MKTSTTGLWFLAVGLAAAAVHALVFAVSKQALRPEVANGLGFVVAFFVSFFGHRHLSFADSSLGLWSSLKRFAVTAGLGFASNEAAFLLFYRWLNWPAWLALFAAMFVAAVQTFVLSRFWAFRRARHPGRQSFS